MNLSYGGFLSPYASAAKHPLHKYLGFLSPCTIPTLIFAFAPFLVVGLWDLLAIHFLFDKSYLLKGA